MAWSTVTRNQVQLCETAKLVFDVGSQLQHLPEL